LNCGQGQEIFHQNFRNGCVVHPAQGVEVATHLRLISRLRISGAILLFPLYHFTTWVGTTSPHFFYFISEIFTAVGDICWSVCIFSSFVSTNCTDTTVLENLLVPEQKFLSSYPTRFH